MPYRFNVFFLLTMNIFYNLANNFNHGNIGHRSKNMIEK